MRRFLIPAAVAFAAFQPRPAKTRFHPELGAGGEHAPNTTPRNRLVREGGIDLNLDRARARRSRRRRSARARTRSARRHGRRLVAKGKGADTVAC